MTDTQTVPEPGAIPVYGIRLTDAYLYESRVRRIVRRRKLTAPRLETELIARSIGPGGKELVVVIAAKVTLPYREGAFEAKVECSVLGEFHSDEEIAEDAATLFAEGPAVVMLYPYLRSMAGELGRMTGLSFPPLPTMDVTEFLAAMSGANQITPGSDDQTESETSEKPASRKRRRAPAKAR